MGCLQSSLPGRRARSLFLEQRVHHVYDRRELWRGDADHVRAAVQDFQGSLEPDDRGPRLQRPQVLHGDEWETVRRTHFQLQAGATAREEEGEGARGVVAPTGADASLEPQPAKRLHERKRLNKKEKGKKGGNTHEAEKRKR